MSKEYHIVLGEIAQNVLLQSNLIDFSGSAELIVLQGNFTEGKLFDLKTLEGFDERVKWFEKYYQHAELCYPSKEYTQYIVNKLTKITSSDSIYLWLGNEGNEYVWLAAVLDFMKDNEANKFHIDWSDVQVKNQVGNWISLYSLNVCDSTNVHLVIDKFRTLSVKEMNKWSTCWRNLLKQNADLRFLKDGIIEVGDISYFDELLLSNCTREYQTASYVVGMTLISIYDKYKGAGIGDFFLFERLEQLVQLGKLDLTEMVIQKPNATNWFKVKLKNN